MSSNSMETDQQHNWNGYTLLMPSVCHCHIGQIAVDILINSLKMKSSMLLNWTCVEPVVGYDPYFTNESQQKENSSFTENLAFPCEVYEEPRMKLLVIQQRGGIVPGRRQEFVSEVLSFAKKYQLKEIILLTSFNAVERTDAQLTSDQFRYLSTDNSLINQFSSSDYNWVQLEERHDKGHHKTLRERDHYYIAGGGIANRLFHAAKEEKFPLTLLIIFTDVGKEAYHSYELLVRLNKWKNYNKDNRWQIPMSQKAWLETTNIPPIY